MKSILSKKILNLVLILILGGLGGILADQLLVPYLSTGNRTTIINPTEKIIIVENIALEEAIDKVRSRLVAVHTYQNKNLINRGTGFFVTSDGFFVTSDDLVSSQATQYLVFRNNHSLAATLIKRDLENNMALFQVADGNLPVVSMASLEDLRLGERVILVGVELINARLSEFVNLGIIRSIGQQTLTLNLTEESSLANGSPLINIRGEVIGLNLVDSQGLLKTIPADKIKEFIGL